MEILLVDLSCDCISAQTALGTITTRSITRIFRHKDRETERQRERETERETERQRETTSNVQCDKPDEPGDQEDYPDDKAALLLL